MENVENIFIIHLFIHLRQKKGNWAKQKGAKFGVTNGHCNWRCCRCCKEKLASSNLYTYYMYLNHSNLWWLDIHRDIYHLKCWLCVYAQMSVLCHFNNWASAAGYLPLLTLNICDCCNKNISLQAPVQCNIQTFALFTLVLTIQAVSSFSQEISLTTCILVFVVFILIWSHFYVWVGLEVTLST